MYLYFIVRTIISDKLNPFSCNGNRNCKGYTGRGRVGPEGRESLRWL